MGQFCRYKLVPDPLLLDIGSVYGEIFIVVVGLDKKN